MTLMLAASPVSDLEYTVFELDTSGTATLLQVDGHTIVVDTGKPQDDSDFDFVDALSEKGVERIDLLVLTHPHDDHIGQAADVIGEFPVDEVWLPNVETDTGHEQKMVDSLPDVVQPRAGDSATFGGLTLDVLAPAELLPAHETHVATNHDSLVMLATYGETTMMLPGDALMDVEISLVDQVTDVDVLILGHHGAQDATSNLWLDALQPEIAVYSAHGGNPEVPHPYTLDKLISGGIDTFGSDVHGTITLTSDGVGWSVETATGEPALDSSAHRLPVVDPVDEPPLWMLGALAVASMGVGAVGYRITKKPDR